MRNRDVHVGLAQAIRIAAALQGSEKGASGGVATLDENGKLSESQIPESLLGGWSYQTTFNADTGIDGRGGELPEPAASNKGWYWVCDTGGTYTPPGGTAPMSVNVGDWLVSDGTSYGKINNTVIDLAARQLAAQASADALQALEYALQLSQQATGPQGEQGEPGPQGDTAPIIHIQQFLVGLNRSNSRYTAVFFSIKIRLLRLFSM
jgi:hypothetical protein